MIEILRKLSIGSHRHASEEELLRLADGEMRAWQARRLHRHLEQCWTCRSRHEQVQGAIRDFVEHRQRIVLPHLPLGNGRRDQLLKRLEELTLDNTQAWTARAAQFLRSAAASMMNPVFATVLIVIAAATAIVVVWQHNAPTVSANQLLDRAEVWDSSKTAVTRAGVVYQKVEIRTPSVTFDHSVYRDIEGRRRPRRGSASLQQAALQSAFNAGGVDWQRPLSAYDYRKWNAQLREKKDEVFSEQRGTLTLRTSTNTGEVQEESLTVRNADFHPVARRLVLRDVGEIDISEVSYDVLPWNAINVAELFEPEPPSPPLAAPLRRPLVPLPSLAALDQAELRARLALNDVGADTGEDISVARNRSSVTITGFVETEPRKREIDQALAGLPLVSSSVSTFEVRNQQLATVDQSQPSSIRQQDVVAQGSPLDTYLAARSVSPDQASQVSRDLLDDALEIDRQAMALDALEKRFPQAARNSLSPENTALLQQLFRRHLSALNQTIQKEQQLIGSYVDDSSSDNALTAANVSTADLVRVANENRQLSGELLAQGKDGQRSGALILADLGRSLLECERMAKSLGPNTN